MSSRGRPERNRIPSDQLVNFSRYVAPPEDPPKSDTEDVKPRVRSTQRNLRCYIADIGVPFDQLPIARPNLTVDWNTIDLVDLMVDEDTPVTCPICLDESLSAPRIARCGHAYCWLCILKYLNFDKKTEKRPCPMCLQFLFKGDLKPVRFQVKKKPTVLSFALLLQEVDAHTAVLHPDICELLCGNRRMRDGNQIASFNSLDIQFCDVAFTDQLMLRELLKRDYLDLEQVALSTDEGDTATHEAVGEALRQLNDNGISIPNNEEFSFLDGLHNIKDSILHLRNVSDSYVYGKTDDREENTDSGGRKKHYCFYQSIDGCKVLLHPQLLKCLWHCCGKNVNQLPLFLVNLPVLSLEEIVVTSGMCRRYNWLNHFRMGCKVYFAHVPLEGYVSPTQLEDFMISRQIKLDMKLSKMLQLQEGP
ncbi:RING finger protein 10 [Babesia sp. Xinjiang]|uniref:RING finger protein 10 n=1 Tax=Babesia sp. Xinjiang TaxID=462227 RepID=UPI000A22DC52|nr:RING finger protein 10 [Babesia sp. Xinjiang]ORM39398.1 RING finger protein 10 [Babesia sp. Xinjiang]